ncbi:hypothetical protein H0H87_007874 [Tephrocybe sp. NHM501043]|nr:hypothetical protein H0H87_007874 [Tephrocybe sp. NHM501043]
MTQRIVLVYTTTLLSPDDQQALLQEFNNPQRPIRTEIPVHFGFADAKIVGGDVETVVPLHKASRFAGAEIEPSLVIVADDGVSPSSRPQTVLLVKILDGRSDQRGVSGHQAIRILASNVAEVFATIASGQHGWEDYWKVAQANGGHFPGE